MDGPLEQTNRAEMGKICPRVNKKYLPDEDPLDDETNDVISILGLLNIGLLFFSVTIWTLWDSSNFKILAFLSSISQCKFLITLRDSWYSNSKSLIFFCNPNILELSVSFSLRIWFTLSFLEGFWMSCWQYFSSLHFFKLWVVASKSCKRASTRGEASGTSGYKL